MRPTPFTGYETQARDVGHYFHGIRDTKTRDTGHKCTGYGAHITGYEAPIPRDTGHAIHGIRDTDFTGYEAQEKSLKRLGTLTQQAFQDSEKII
jgi:hypothetical protein